MTAIPNFATVDPYEGMTEEIPGWVRNLVAGNWVNGDSYHSNIVDPLKGGEFLRVPDTRDFSQYLLGLKSCPKSGLHNPLKNPDRYIMLGRVCARAATRLAEPAVERYFAKLIQRVMPKSWQQCIGEVTVTRIFLENFAGDSVRFLARGFSNPGDHVGQESRGYRWPFGPVVVIAPFNFPLEIPALQVMGALFMGNRPLVKVASKVSVVFEQFVRLLLESGLPAGDLDLIHCSGQTMGRLLEHALEDLRLVQFTGSSDVAEDTSTLVNGAIRLEDAGFDWKIIGPDYDPAWLDYVAWQCDEDAYNASGQKCSAQSILFIHNNWAEELIPKITQLAARRKLDNLTLGPVLTWTDEQMLRHIAEVKAIPGAQLLFGGEPIERGEIPFCYGAIQATAVQVPIDELLGEHFETIATELFGPFQVVILYDDQTLPLVLEAFEKIPQHLTAAVVSNDQDFQQQVLSATVNGTTYCGMRARTTGAPQNHWFGPNGDPRAAGIGTSEAIINTWSGHREIIIDQGPLPTNWATPDSR